ncbi:hypothetical protein [uncultured Ferrimonas sp.]|nr:hypothetical protein [uncultured Ferrimonas sp.]
MFELFLLALLAIPLTLLLRPVLSFGWAFAADAIARRFGENIDD